MLEFTTMEIMKSAFKKIASIVSASFIPKEFAVIMKAQIDQMNEIAVLCVKIQKKKGEAHVNDLLIKFKHEAYTGVVRNSDYIINQLELELNNLENGRTTR